MPHNYAIQKKYEALKKLLREYDGLHELQKPIEIRKVLRIWD